MSKAVAKQTEATGSVVEAIPQTAEVTDAFLAMIERAARDPSVDLDKMERLYALKEQNDTRRARSAFLAAFSALQSDLPSVERKGTGHNAKKYARFEDFVEAIRPKLSQHGFSLSHRVTQPTPDRIHITAVLGHREGHQEETTLALPMDTSGNKTAVHALASSISYGKRYTGMAIIGVATEDEDDDGKAAGAGTLITEEQETELRDLIEAKQAEIPKFCAYFKIEKLGDLKASDFQRAMTALKKRGANG